MTYFNNKEGGLQQAPNADGLEEHTEQITDADWLEILPGLKSNWLTILIVSTSF